jgi:hypothetical protein
MLAASSSEFQSWEHKYDVPYDCPNCGVAWSDKPETWACGANGCQCASCDDCKVACYSCGEVFCAEHLRKTADGPCCRGCAQEIEEIASEDAA